MAFKWTAPRTWVSGETVTAALGNAHWRDNMEALNGYVLKTANESVTSSTTLQDDNHLLFTIPQAGTYVIDVHLIVSSAANAAGDLNVGATFPTGTCTAFGYGLDSTLASGSTGTANFRAQSFASGTAAATFGASTTFTAAVLRFLLVATASGTFTLQWAQATSNANATTLLAGSHMTVKQVA